MHLLYPKYQSESTSNSTNNKQKRKTLKLPALVHHINQFIMPGDSELPRRRGPAPPPLQLDIKNLSIDRDDDMVEDAQATEGQDEKMTEDKDADEKDDKDVSILTFQEECELFGPPPPSPRGLPTGRPRRKLETPVGFVPTTNDRYLNPMREHYVPPRDPFRSPFADIPFNAQTENYRPPRRRSTQTSNNRTPITRRRPSGIHRSNGLPPLPQPLRYENPAPPRPRISSSSRLTPQSATLSAAAAAVSSSSSADKAEDSTSKQPTRKD